MKQIYIRKADTHHNKLYIFLAALILLFIALRVAAPYVLEAYINTTGTDEKGYRYRVEDIDLKLLKGQVGVRSFNMFKREAGMNFVEARDIVFDMDPLRAFDREKIFSVNVGSVEFVVSKDLFEEVNRVKNEAKEKAPGKLYIQDLKAKIGTINVKQVRDEKAEPIITLKNARAHITDLGVGSRKENTEFALTSLIAEGGQIDLSGKTKLEAENTPWEINGEMKQIPAAVLDKLAGDKLPIEITQANVDASITARSGGGQIEGKIVPEIKEFKLSEDKDEGFIKRNVAKAANFLFDKTKGENQEISLTLPFTLNENFTVDVPDTIQKITQ